MSETGRLHDVGDPDAVEALLAKQAAGRFEYPFAVLGEFLAADLHHPSPCRPVLTNYMMDDINRQHT
ncbi:MAG: hypothetical protein WDM84_03050 [Bauldia sp.]